MWRKILAAISLAVMLASPAAAAFDSEPFVGRGVVRAVRWIDGDVMLQNEEGFQLVILEADAAVRDAYGAPLSLRDLPLGAEVEYEGRYWEGLTLAFSLRVSARSVVARAR